MGSIDVLCIWTVEGNKVRKGEVITSLMTEPSSFYQKNTRNTETDVIIESEVEKPSTVDNIKGRFFGNFLSKFKEFIDKSE